MAIRKLVGGPARYKRQTEKSASFRRVVQSAFKFAPSRARLGGWEQVGKAVRANRTNLSQNGSPITASLAFRVARFVGVKVDDLLEGRFPPWDVPALWARA
jgi:hypothetical protein